jgi:uncharacterized protein YjiS (DUF1127 family)
MSCGSARCAPADDIQIALSSFPDHGRFWRTPLSWLARSAWRSERRHQHRQPLELSDRLLADIGISGRHPVEEALRSSWIRILMWHVHP